MGKDATIRLKTAVFGLKSKPKAASPDVKAALEQWRQARRSGDRGQARAAYVEVVEARRRAAEQGKQ